MIGAQQDDSFMAVCTAPSFNKTSSGSVIPCIVSAKLGNSINTSPNVKFNGNPVYILNQTTQPSCIGDVAGNAGGIRSGTVGDEVKPISGSCTVFVNKCQVIRAGDPCTMNNGNCFGIYVTVPKPKGKACCDDCHDSNPPIECTEKEKAKLKSGLLNSSFFIESKAYQVADAGLTGGFLPRLAGGAAGEGAVLVEAGEGAVLMEAGEGAVLMGAGEAAAALAELLLALEPIGWVALAVGGVWWLYRQNSPVHTDTETQTQTRPKEKVIVKARPKMDCGEEGSYGDLKKKTGEGKYDRDHIPSKGALKKRAADILGKLNDCKERAINNAGWTIAIPRAAHAKVSPTYGQSKAQIAKDAADLQKSANRDIDEMIKKGKELFDDDPCMDEYVKKTKKIKAMTNEEYDKWLKNVIANSGC